MKRTLLITLLVAFIIMAFNIADDIITRLGMNHRNAQYSILKNFAGRFTSGEVSPGYEGDPNSIFNQLQTFQIPSASMLANIITGDKTGAAKDLCEYVKKYVSSEEFIAEYTYIREDAMPLNHEGSSIASLRKNMIVYQKNIDNYKTDKKYVAEQKEMLDNDQKSIDALIAASKKPFPNKEFWEKIYPADPAVMVKERLQEYLKLVATVDFNAQLTGSGKMKKFVNPAYEKKSLKWKAIFRAGKEVNDVVTAFVKEWMKGEIISKEKTKMANNEAPAQNKTGSNSNINTSPATVKPTIADTTKINTPANTNNKPGLNKLKNKLKTIIKN